MVQAGERSSVGRKSLLLLSDDVSEKRILKTFSDIAMLGGSHPYTALAA